MKWGIDDRTISPETRAELDAIWAKIAEAGKTGDVVMQKVLSAQIEAVMICSTIRYANVMTDRILQGVPKVSTLTHGTNADCPQVRSGEWERCHGHTQPLGVPTA